jgi:hypothetical protein
MKRCLLAQLGKERGAEKVACTQGFLKPASGTKGPMDLFEGFQQGTKGASSTHQRKNDP